MASSVVDLYVWLPHDELVWVPALIAESSGGTTKYKILPDHHLVEIAHHVTDPKKLERVNPSALSESINNLVQLDDINEGGVIHQLRERYSRDVIYTNIGTILVSINPYKQLAIYTNSMIDKYREDAVNMPPHVFAIAADAFQRIKEERQNQAIIISGESGAGKTEATKTVLQFLSTVAGSSSGVEQEILQSNPVLESFGNAKTLRNNNSSRFGKWMEVMFDGSNHICSAKIINYLLEKSRVVGQTKTERNYHIFYQFLEGITDEQRAQLGIKGDFGDYGYLKQSECFHIDGVSNKQQFGETFRAMRALNFSPADVDNIMKVLASILQLGNLKLRAERISNTDGTKIDNMDLLQVISKNLGFSTDALATALTYRSVTIRNELSMIPLNILESTVARDAFAKSLYGKLFDWLVWKINCTLWKQDSKLSIGILDIFGFEIFDNNLFEQFCINFANEKLQQHFNNHIFRLEQQDYQKEGIDVKKIEFIDNLECLELIEKKSTGILPMLDEEVRLPNGSDKSFLTKLHQTFAPNDKQKHRHYDVIKKSPNVFVIKHYAGDVTYNSEGLLAKNKDRLHDTLEALIPKSTSAIVTKMYELGGDDTPEIPLAGGAAGHRRVGSSGNKHSLTMGASSSSSKKVQTLGYQFTQQLNDLMFAIHQRYPQFVRCIKPNPNKSPNEYQTKMVLRQLKYSGIFEAIRLKRSGFSFQKEFAEFVYRYRVLIGKTFIRQLRDIATNPKLGTELVIKSVSELDSKEWALGKTKVYMRSSQRIILDRLREIALTKKVIKIQATFRMYDCKKFYRRLKEFYRRCKTMLSSRDINAIKKILQEADDNGYELFILVSLNKWVKYLDDETKAAKKLQDAIAANELELLTEALEVSSRLQAKFPYPNYIFPADFQSLLGKARAAKEHLEWVARVRRELQEAVLSEDMKRLEVAIAEAKKAKLPIAEIAEAEELLAHLIAEERVMEALRAQMRANNPDPTPLEKAIVEANKITLDEKRTGEIQSARSMLQSKYATILHSEQQRKNESAIRNQLIPKFQSLNFPSLVEEAGQWLLEEDRKRREEEARRREEEERRRREEERKREEARLAQERAHLAEAEKRRLAEQDRLRREAEEKQLKERAEAQRRQREVEFQHQQEQIAAMAFASPRSSMPPPVDFGEDLPPPPPEDDMPPPPPEDFPPPPGGYTPEDEPDLPPPPAGFKATGMPILQKAVLPPLPAHMRGNVGVGGRPIPPPPSGPPPPIDTGKQRDDALNAAIKEKNLPMLVELLREAEQAHHNSRIFRVAQNLVKTLKEIQTVTTALQAAIDAIDPSKLKELLRVASQLGMTDEIVAQARHIAYGMSAAEIISARLSRAMEKKDVAMVKELLREAAEENVETEEIEAARDFVAMQGAANDWNSRMRQAKSAQQSIHDAYLQFMSTRGTMPLNSFQFIRREGNYAKRHYFNKASIKEEMFVWQRDDIPRSLVKLSTAYCGEDKKKSKSVKEVAKQIFKNVRCYMGDLYHPFPASLALEVIQTGVNEPLLRDEIFCELIKQTTRNPNNESILLGLKLFYMCISTFKPSNELIPCILSHLSQFAHAKIPTDSINFYSIADVASQCFLVYESQTSRQTNDMKPRDFKIPSMQDIEKLTAGTLTAKAVHRESFSALKGQNLAPGQKRMSISDLKREAAEEEKEEREQMALNPNNMSYMQQRQSRGSFMSSAALMGEMKIGQQQRSSISAGFMTPVGSLPAPPSPPKEDGMGSIPGPPPPLLSAQRVSYTAPPPPPSSLPHEPQLLSQRMSVSLPSMPGVRQSVGGPPTLNRATSPLMSPSSPPSEPPLLSQARNSGPSMPISPRQISPTTSVSQPPVSPRVSLTGRPIPGPPPGDPNQISPQSSTILAAPPALLSQRKPSLIIPPSPLTSPQISPVVAPPPPFGSNSPVSPNAAAAPQRQSLGRVPGPPPGAPPAAAFGSPPTTPPPGMAPIPFGVGKFPPPPPGGAPPPSAMRQSSIKAAPPPPPEPVNTGPVVGTNAPAPPPMMAAAPAAQKTSSLADQIKATKLKKSTADEGNAAPPQSSSEDGRHSPTLSVSSVTSSTPSGLGVLASSINTSGLKAIINARVSTADITESERRSAILAASKPQKSSDDWDEDDEDVAHFAASKFNRVHEVSLLPPKPEEEEAPPMPTAPRVINEPAASAPVNEARISVSAAKDLFKKAAPTPMPVIVPKGKAFKPKSAEEKKDPVSPKVAPSSPQPAAPAASAAPTEPSPSAPSEVVVPTIDIPPTESAPQEAPAVAAVESPKAQSLPSPKAQSLPSPKAQSSPSPEAQSSPSTDSPPMAPQAPPLTDEPSSSSESALAEPGEPDAPPAATESAPAASHDPYAEVDDPDLPPPPQ